MRDNGQLVEKDRFFSEVWDDVVVSEGALPWHPIAVAAAAGGAAGLIILLPGGHLRGGRLQLLARSFAA